MQPLDPLTIPCEGVRLVEASAGTGKTYTIAALYLRLLLEKGLTVRQILVVTYTVAATEELRDRLRARLREALVAISGGAISDDLLGAQIARVADREEAKRRLADAITCIDEAAIFTIHGFCQRMLQENAFESGTLFEAELMEDENDLIVAIAEDFWRRRLANESTAIASLLKKNKLDTPSALLLKLRRYLGHANLEVRPINAAQDDFGPQSFLDCHETMVRLWEEERSTILKLLENPDLKRGPYKPEAVLMAAESMDAYLGGVPLVYALPEMLELFTPEHLADNLKPSKKKKDAVPPTHPFFELSGRLAAMIEKWVAALLRDALDYFRIERARRKRARGLLAFDDLLTNLRTALEGSESDLLAERIAARFPVALIDEFQDTDPEQYQIFASIYRGRGDKALFMIGDPKQAIYSFRGADVFTYMKAKEDTDKAARYTLDTNWRSTSSLIRATNALYTRAAAPFIYRGQIDYFEIRPSEKADREPLHISGVPPTPLRVWWMPLTEENQYQGSVKAGWIQEHLPDYCAEEIAQLLELSVAGDARIGEKPLQPRDIAVLVRDRHEAAAVQRALRRRKINSAYYARESVYASEEAEELERILLAIAEPHDEGLLRAALCSLIWGIGGNELAALQEDEEAWESLVVRVQHYHHLWLKQGFMAMFRRLLQEQRVGARLFRLEDGERRMTNLLQLSELLQAASRLQRGIEGLLRWFTEQRMEPNGDSEEQQLRLESDEDLVKIVTVHKSKGLEYPVVFLPFAWKAKPVGEGPVLFHDAVTRAPILDLSGAPESRALAERERLAEDLRLFYVALTRAKHLCYLAWGKFRDSDRGALGWLLHGTDADVAIDEFGQRMKAIDEEALRACLEEWSRDAGGAVAIVDPPRVKETCHVPQQMDVSPLKARKLRRPLGWQWRVTSYTALVAGHGDGERPEYGSAAEDRAEEAGRTAQRTILDFPRGARAGTFMHHLFERIDFPEARGELLQQAVQREMVRHGYGEEWAPVIGEMVGNVLDAPLDDGLRLRDITSRRRLIELEFHYPLVDVNAGELERIVTGLGGYQSDAPALQFGMVTGIMRGFMDLVFEHEGRYYIADYKSNYLGPRRELYGRDALRAAVSANRYDFQYLIYTVALHRYLRRRVPDYDYVRHFGGVYYLFLRGMSPTDPGLGVYFDRPEAVLIETLDDLFAGRRL